MHRVSISPRIRHRIPHRLKHPEHLTPKELLALRLVYFPRRKFLRGHFVNRLWKTPAADYCTGSLCDADLRIDSSAQCFQQNPSALHAQSTAQIAYLLCTPRREHSLRACTTASRSVANTLIAITAKVGRMLLASKKEVMGSFISSRKRGGLAGRTHG